MARLVRRGPFAAGAATVLLFLLCRSSDAFQPPANFAARQSRESSTVDRHRNANAEGIHPYSRLVRSPAAASDGDEEGAAIAPQVFATGYSTKPSLLEAIQEATDKALTSLPPPSLVGDGAVGIDLATIVVSSLYDGQASPSVVVPAVLSSGSVYGAGIRRLVGCTSGGLVSCSANVNVGQTKGASAAARECTPVENEGLPGVSVTLALLPDVDVQTFFVLGDDVPDDVGRVPPQVWKGAVGLRDFGEGSDEDESPPPPVFMLMPSPAFQNDLDDLLRGFNYVFPGGKTFGGIASTVSSLSRARLFRYDASEPQGIQTHADGCVGVAMQGDIDVKVMVAQGAKPVGGIYRIVSGGDSTIGAIVLDEAATEDDLASREDVEEEEEEEEGGAVARDAKALAAADYAKARIPKPILAEANFVMKTLSDDDQSFMRKAILVGLERGGSLGTTPNELARLAAGEGHRFTVHQVASAGMKDGSVTLPLGSVDIQSGTRTRFFVREGGFAKKEVEALWTGYKKQTLKKLIEGNAGHFTPTACMVIPTLDRGTTLFGGKPGFESGAVSDFLPTVSSISGFFSNGVIGKLDEDESSGQDAMLHGSSSCYAVLGSRTERPVFSPAKAAAAEAAAAKKKAQEEAAEEALAAENEKRAQLSKSSFGNVGASPRSEDGELILKRREVHSGRAISVSTVEWSVAEKIATPSSALEGYMWDKETEVDRFRERVPLSNLLSQCKLAMVDPSKPKPRDWIGPVKQAGAVGGFVIIPECKRMEPTTGSLRKRYDLPKLVKQLTKAGAPAISVNCDGVMFGGSLEDVTKAREASSSAAVLDVSSSSDGVVAPPILASDLLLYPYQLYKLRLEGADAVALVVGALEKKDLLYMTKIASSLKLQTVASVTSEVQIRSCTDLSPGSIHALVVSNRDLEHFTFDESGEQALSLLQSDALRDFREKHGFDVPILVEGRVGIIETMGEDGTKSSSAYIKKLKDAGAFGAIVGGGLATKNEESGEKSLELLRMES